MLSDQDIKNIAERIVAKVEEKLEGKLLDEIKNQVITDFADSLKGKGFTLDELVKLNKNGQEIFISKAAAELESRTSVEEEGLSVEKIVQGKFNFVDISTIYDLLTEVSDDVDNLSSKSSTPRLR